MLLLDRQPNPPRTSKSFLDSAPNVEPSLLTLSDPPPGVCIDIIPPFIEAFVSLFHMFVLCAVWLSNWCSRNSGSPLQLGASLLAAC